MRSLDRPNWLLGVDGGGSKTHFLLCRVDGQEQSFHVGPGTYYLEIGVEGVAGVIGSGIEALCQQAGIPPASIAHAFFGLPSYGESPGHDAVLQDLPAKLLGHRRYTCDNDVVCGWAGSLGGDDGINIVSGTGSIAYGQRGSAAARCGGWGELFGDEGSAYWTAIRGLNAFTQMSDGRLSRTALYEVFRTTLELHSDFQVIERFLEQDGSRKTLAGLAPLVSKAADAGDPVAIQILSDAAAALALQAATLAHKLGYEPADLVPVSYSGGMFNKQDKFVQRFEAALGQSGSNFQLRVPMYPPHVGAVLAAARFCEVIDRSTAMPKLRASFA